MHSVWRRAGTFGWVVIPTSVGYTKKGLAIFGRGIAKEANQRFPDLAVDYGEVCCKYRELTPVTVMRLRAHGGATNVVLLPVQSYNERAPHLSWREPATVKRVSRSLQELKALLPAAQDRPMVYIGDVGCSNGLRVGDVREMISATFDGDARIVHIKGLR